MHGHRRHGSVDGGGPGDGEAKGTTSEGTSPPSKRAGKGGESKSRMPRAVGMGPTATIVAPRARHPSPRPFMTLIPTLEHGFQNISCVRLVNGRLSRATSGNRTNAGCECGGARAQAAMSDRGRGAACANTESHTERAVQFLQPSSGPKHVIDRGVNTKDCVSWNNKSSPRTLHMRCRSACLVQGARQAFCTKQSCRRRGRRDSDITYQARSVERGGPSRPNQEPKLETSGNASTRNAQRM